MKGFARFIRLAPSRELLKETDRQLYEVRFKVEVLDRLDPRETWIELHRIADGEEPVLLCYERLEHPHEWCHRRMVAEWFARTLREEVHEVVGQQRIGEL
jgi:hypothetical protein